MAAGPLAGFDLVIFDCDGVLVDSERLQVALEARVLADLGWPVTPGEVARRWMGRPHAEQLAEVAERLGSDTAAAFDEEIRGAVPRLFEAELTTVPGVVAVLDELDSAGTPYCVASSGTPRRMSLTLGLTGLQERFAGRQFSSTEVQRGKPAPDVFLHAARRMGVPPARCVVVEDSENGVRAAVAAGMTVLGFAGGLAEEKDLRAAGARPFLAMTDLLGVR